VYEISPSEYPNCAVGLQYAYSVLNNPEKYCKLVQYQVQRFFKDIDRASKPDAPFYIVLENAERYMRLAQKFKHVKGKWKTPNITFEPWQKFKYLNLFMFNNSITKRRRFRTAYLSTARGSGKSAEASQLGLYFLALEGEVGPEVVCASTKKDAARIVFDSARFMAEKNKSFLKNTGTIVQQHLILHPKSNGIMKPLSSDPKSQDGLNPSLILGDEIHEWTRGLYDVLDSAMSKRNDSLFVMITTAGFNTESIGHEIDSYAIKVLKGETEDDTWFSSIYRMDDGDDWLALDSWEKANPNWGVSIDPINFEAKAKKALETPASKNNFIVKHLNCWTNSASPFFSIDHWDKCKVDGLKIEHMGKSPAVIGLDLASKIDLTCSIYVFYKDKKIQIFCDSYIPEARLTDKKNAMYVRWVEEGWLKVHKGEVIDMEKIQLDIIERKKTIGIKTAMFDPWNATAVAQGLEKAKVDMTEFRMTTGNFSEPMKTLDAKIRSLEVEHPGDPVLRWCLQNVVVKPDANDNVFPRKEHERFKIDLAVGAIMGLAGWVNDISKSSVYESRGLRIL